MWESIAQFCSANSASIIVSVLIGAVFFILGPLGLWFSGKKVRREKIYKAKSDFLDLTESMMVNKDKIDVPKLLILFRAVERQNGIDLGLESDIENLLGDLALRFSQSKHLSSEQKDAYLDQINALIEKLYEPVKHDLPAADETSRVLPKSMQSVVTELRQLAEKLNSAELKEKADALEKNYRRPNDPFYSMFRVIRERPMIFLGVSIGYIVAVVYFLFWMKK